ncbi:MAG: hypothetical protein K0V04_03200 [Deltaproteobacteria bacterium]|nr:hypothetical protein [Deltaproteobacteria bacterium]
MHVPLVPLSAVAGFMLVMSACGESADSPMRPAGSTSSASATGGSPPPTGAPATSNSEQTAGPTAGDTTDASPATFGDGSTAPQFCPPDAEASIELGLGDVDFRPVDSEPAQVILGHQGGYHVVIGVRGVGLDLAEWGEGHLTATVNGQVVADHNAVILMHCSDDGAYSEALWINLIFDDDPSSLLGLPMEVEAQYVDASNQQATATAELTLSDEIAGD